MGAWTCKRRRVPEDGQEEQPDDRQAYVSASICPCQKRWRGVALEEDTVGASRKFIAVVAVMTGERLCEVLANDSLTVEGLRNAVKAEHFFDCRIDFLYGTKKLSDSEELLLDVLDFGDSSIVELGFVKVREILFYTEDDGIYKEPPDVPVFSNGAVKYVMFSIRGARNDTHVGLFPGAMDIRRPFYEFVIDGWGGHISGVRRGRGAPQLAEPHHHGQLLDPRQAREFWVSVDSSTGEVAMGVGSDISQKRLLRYTDANVLPVASIGVMTKHGASATWTFNL